MSEPEDNSPDLVNGAEMTDAVTVEPPDLDLFAGLAMQKCTDPTFDAGALYERAEGVTLSDVVETQLNAHLEACLHCRVAQDVFAQEISAHAARSETDKAATLSELLRQASVPQPKRNVGARVIPFPIWGKQTAGLLTAAAALLAVGIALKLPVSPASIEVTRPDGAVARTMDKEPNGSAPARFAPSGVYQVTVRLTEEAPRSEATPQIYSFFERDGRLVALPESVVVSQKRTETWVSIQLAVPVGEVLGERAGLRKLWYASTRTHDIRDLEGLRVEEALEDDDIAWTLQEIEVITP